MSTTNEHRPLVEFTSLAIGGAGLIAATAAFVGTDVPAWRTIVAIALILLAFGVVRSLGHLGRQTRALHVWRGLGRSPISGEILLASAVLASGAVMLAGATINLPISFLRASTTTAAVLFLISIGRVYRLGGQRTWGGPAALIPLTSGAAAGTTVLASQIVPLIPTWGAWCLIGVDGLVFASYAWQVIRVHRMTGTPRAESWQTSPITFLSARVVLLDVLPAALLVAWPRPAVALVVALGLWLDRTSFYLLAAPHGTEAEIARVEAVIAAISSDE